MLKHYLKIAFRFFSKHKLYTLLNLFGLTIGLTAFTLVFLYAHYEMNYDISHKSHQRIYRLKRTATIPVEYSTIRFRDSVIKRIEENFPDVDQVCRFHVRPGFIRHEQVFFKIDHVVRTQPVFFRMFDYTPLYGNPESALKDAYSVILTKSVSEKIFGNQNPVGKVVNVGIYEKCDMTIKAVIEDLPENSHINANVFVPTTNSNFYFDMMSSHSKNAESKYDLIYYVYLSLKPEISVSDFLNKLHADLLAHDVLQKFKAEKGAPDKHELVPLSEIYLSDSTDENGMKHNNAGKIAILLGIAFLILTIAIVNYINLTTARSLVRATEIGIKKTIGAQRLHLIKQILLESVLVCVIASIIALVLTEFLLNPFNQFIQKDLNLSILYQFPNSLIVIFVVILIGLTAGLYPGLYLSKFRPITVLRDAHPKSQKGSKIRNGLLVFQFTISIILITSFLVSYGQLSFMNQKSLGFKIDQLLHIKLPSSVHHKGSVIRNKLLQNSQISDVSLSQGVPGGVLYMNSGMENLNGQKTECTHYMVSPDFLKTFQMEIIQGRNLFPEEKNGRLINESFAKFMGWEAPYEDVVGKDNIVGIVKDFHYESLHHVIRPLTLFLNRDFTPDLTIRLASQDIFTTMEFIKTTWKELFPDEYLEYYFYDDHFNQMYQSAESIQKLLTWAAFFAIFVSGLGLLGLSLFTIENRTKEIGIRKVLGGTVSQITVLLSKDLYKWVLVSNLIAWPVAWFAMNKWLQSFAYRIEMSWWMFALAGGLALLIALATVSWQAVRAASANPVEALRYE